MVTSDRSLESDGNIPPSESPQFLSAREEEVEQIALQLTNQFPFAAELYHQLIIMIPDPNQTNSFRKVVESIKNRSINYINVNLELSCRLLELRLQQRWKKAESLLKEIVGNTQEDVIFLDWIEILFDVNLKLDPLKCLQGLSRSRTVVAVWRGSFENNYLIYAEPNHPEYHRYPKADFLLIDLRKSEDNFS